MIRRVIIETIPHTSQRYDTVGDWIIEGDVLTLKVSDMGDWRMNMACALHEMGEAMLCHQDGVAEVDVSAFDVTYEKARQEEVAAPCGCVPTEESEPGEDAHAPYRKQHAFADGIERLFALEIGLLWSDYNAKVYSLDYYSAENGEATEDVDG